MRLANRLVVCVLFLLVGAGSVLPAWAQSSGVDPRFETRSIEIVDGSSNGEIWVRVKFDQGWTSIPLDPWTAYLDVMVELDDSTIAMAWNLIEGSVTSEVLGDAVQFGWVSDDFGWTGRLLNDGSIMILLPVRPDNLAVGTNFWVTVDAFAVPDADTNNPSSTVGMRFTTGALFGTLDSVAWPTVDMATGDEIKSPSPVTPASEQSVPTKPIPAPSAKAEVAAPAPSVVLLTPTDLSIPAPSAGGGIPLWAGFGVAVLLVALSLGGFVMIRRVPLFGYGLVPPPGADDPVIEPLPDDDGFLDIEL